MLSVQVTEMSVHAVLDCSSVMQWKVVVKVRVECGLSIFYLLSLHLDIMLIFTINVVQVIFVSVQTIFRASYDTLWLLTFCSYTVSSQTFYHLNSMVDHSMMDQLLALLPSLTCLLYTSPSPRD